MLRISRLSVAIGVQGARGVAILEGIELDLVAGGALGIVGESGCGKSTLASAIVGVLPSSMRATGEICLNGENLLELSRERRRQVRRQKIAFIPQDPAASLNPVYTIGNQIEETISGTRMERCERALDLLSEVRVTAARERLGAYPHMLSGGIKQRVLGAMALSSQPRLVIADEPTTALDVTVQAEYLNLLAELRRRHGFSLLLISHDLGVVASVCDQVAVMYAGRIVESGPKERLFSNPRHPYTRALLKARPSVDKNIDRLDAIGGEPPMPGRWPRGCRFAPRCADARPACGEQVPPSVEVAEHWSAACLFARETLETFP